VSTQQSEEARKDELHVLQTLISALTPLDRETRLRLLETITTFLQIEGVRFVKSGTMDIRDFVTSPSGAPAFATSDVSRSPAGPFSGRPDLSPKEFLLDKEPKTDVERVACLAFYLTHYRSLPEFKTLDISKLNTEAAQVKFSNPAMAVDNATKLGFLVPASKGLKQIGALGEQFVRALPDRDAAKAVRAKIRPRRSKRGGRGNGGEDSNATEEA
jgi:hypothetical protein